MPGQGGQEERGAARRGPESSESAQEDAAVPWGHAVPATPSTSSGPKDRFLLPVPLEATQKPRGAVTGSRSPSRSSTKANRFTIRVGGQIPTPLRDNHSLGPPASCPASLLLTGMRR